MGLVFSRYEYVVALQRDVPEGHHRVILMHDVVTVHGILAQPVAEADKQLHPLVGMQLRDVLAPPVGW